MRIPPLRFLFGLLLVVWSVTVSSGLDYAAGLLGARRVGASRPALIGAALGEYWARRDERRALAVGAATWAGILVGMLAKVVLAFVMVGLFLVALFV